MVVLLKYVVNLKLSLIFFIQRVLLILNQAVVYISIRPPRVVCNTEGWLAGKLSLPRSLLTHVSGRHRYFFSVRAGLWAAATIYFSKERHQTVG